MVCRGEDTAGGGRADDNEVCTSRPKGSTQKTVWSLSLVSESPRSESLRNPQNYSFIGKETEAQRFCPSQVHTRGDVTPKEDAEASHLCGPFLPCHRDDDAGSKRNI